MCPHGPSEELPITDQPAESQQSTGRAGDWGPEGQLCPGPPTEEVTKQEAPELRYPGSKATLPPLAFLEFHQTW